MPHAAFPGVVMQIPPGWEDRSQLIIVANDGPDFRANIVLVKEAMKYTDFEAWIVDHLATLQDTFDGFTLRFEGPATFGPHRGHLLDYRFSAGDSFYCQRQFMTFVDMHLYTFTYSNTAAAFDATRDVLEEVVCGTHIVNALPAVHQ